MDGAALLVVASLAALAVIAIAAWLGDDPASAAKKRKPGISLKQQTFQQSTADKGERFVVSCPKGKFPLGGGMFNNTPLGADGEGIYLHSYERLGVQHGWHASTVLIPGRAVGQGTAPRSFTLQVLCGPQLHFRSPHTTVQVNAGETKAIGATCGGKRRLVGGGFQRTDFNSKGGDFVTEMRRTSPRTWHVVGSAYGSFGGELTAIAYCIPAKKPPVSEVAGSTTIAPKAVGTATPPPCPARRKLAFGGFSTSPPDAVFFTDGRINANGSWSASGFNHKGPEATLTAYGYCIGPKALNRD